MRFAQPEEFLNLTKMPEIHGLMQLFQFFLFLARSLLLYEIVLDANVTTIAMKDQTRTQNLAR